MDNKIVLKTFILGLVLEIIFFLIFFFLIFDSDPRIIRIISSSLVALSLVTPICGAFFLGSHSKLENKIILEEQV